MKTFFVDFLSPLRLATFKRSFESALMLSSVIATSCTAATKLLPLITVKYTCRSPHDCVPSRAGTQCHVIAVTIGPATNGATAVRQSEKGAGPSILSVVVHLKTKSVLAP